MDKKKIIWVFISLIIAILTIWTVASQSKNFSFEQLFSFLNASNKLWLAGAFLCMFGFIWFEGYAVVRITKVLGYKKTARQGTLYGAADVYFSSITPSASGGQPASAFFMLRDGIPMTVITTSLLINLIMYSLALLLVGIGSVIFRHDMFIQFSILSKLLIRFGFVILILLSLSFFLLLRKADILYRFCNWGIHFLGKMHFIKRADKKIQKLNQTMSDYQACADTITNHVSMLIEIFILNLLQRLSQLGVSFMIFMSLGKGLSKSLDAFVLQCYVALGSNSLPIPGGMGVADYIMLDGMNEIVGNQAATMEMLCRGTTFYVCIITSAVIVLIGLLQNKVSQNR